MICLGRSNHFRFNHPSDAEYIKHILPNVRISMAPIAFYPAVDNPEYFHMTSQTVGLGEETQRASENHHQEETLGLNNIDKPPIPPRKNSNSNLNCNGNEDDDNYASNKISDIDGCDSAAVASANDSDSDEPPEVPPRSEAVTAHYVNYSSNSTSSFLGEYLYTKAEMGPSVPRVSPGTARVVPGAATVLSPNGSTSVHNALYRSFSAGPQLLTAPSTPLPGAAATGSLPLPEVPAPPVPPSSSMNGNIYFRSHSTGGGMSPSYPQGSHSSGGGVFPHFYPQGHRETSPQSRFRGKSSLEDLRSSELKKQQATVQRMKEEEVAAAEKARLDEILSMCAEYERQQSGDSFSGSPPPNKPQYSSYSLLPQNRIKTNGSLPREKRGRHLSGASPPPVIGYCSPSGPLSPVTPNSLRALTPSEDEIGAIFNFDEHTKNASLTRNGPLARPSYSALSPTSVSNHSPPATPRSPYENVSPPYHHPYPVPQSPRTRIRTTVGKDRRADHCEVIENKFAMSDLPPKDPSSYCVRASSRSPERFHKEMRNNEAQSPPPKPPRSPRIERGILNTYSVGDRDTVTTSASVFDNKYFSPVTPKCKNKITDIEKEEYDTKESDSSANNSSLHQLSFKTTSSLGDLSNCLDTKIKNKVFEEQMLKNIQDTLNINDVAGEIERLNKEKNEIIQMTINLKTQINEIERQENESMRELEMERALVEGELVSTKNKLMQEDANLAALIQHSDEMDKRHAEERKMDSETIKHCKNRLDKAEDDLEETENKHEGFTGTTDEETEMLEILKSQHESVEAERKIFEDTEFSQMESEAHRESEREELNKEISELTEKIRSRKDKICELEAQMSDVTSCVCQETEAMENQRQDLISLVSKESMRLSSVERQLGELARLGISTNGQVSPTCSSDTEEGYVPELAERLARLHLLDRSQEDLDRIHQVTTSSPLGCNNSTFGRKTSATLMEIERNRQLLLVKQGAVTIDNERRRVEELKRRVADEVKAKWEERKAREKREINCASLNSIGSEDSSMASSDLHTESLSSDDVTLQRSNGDNQLTNSLLKMRQRGGEGPACGDEVRPVSEISSCGDTDLSFVKFRDKPKTQQRPLTRYLPVRPEVPFDLRHHIESAGHQVELCPYLKVSPSSCRGYLHKLSSKFRTWQKRWFVFDRTQRTLTYYSDKNELKPKGGATFQEIEEVYVNHLHSADSLTFCIKTYRRTFQLMARSPETMRIWIDVIFTGAEGYREFQGGGS